MVLVHLRYVYREMYFLSDFSSWVDFEIYSISQGRQVPEGSDNLEEATGGG